MSQLTSTHPEGHSTSESDPLGPSQVDGTVNTPGTEEGAYGTSEQGAYATIQSSLPNGYPCAPSNTSQTEERCMSCFAACEVHRGRSSVHSIIRERALG